MKDVRAVSLAKLMIDVRNTFQTPLSQQILFEWHDMIISDPFLRDRIPVGQWRTEPIQIVSGAIGSERVHFEAPPPEIVPKEMARFIQWFNATDPNNGSIKISGPVRSALTHLYFESIHPFADGNGRIGRALSEKALSQDLKGPALLSLSKTIHAAKKEYYKALSFASTNSMDVTSWVKYFVGVVLEAQVTVASKQIGYILKKAELLQQGCLQQLEAGGRSTRYELLID